MHDRNPARPPMRGGWFLRLARQRRLFHNALLGVGAATRQKTESRDPEPGVPVAKPRTRR